MLEEFKDNKHLVRMSPFLVATAMGKADGIFLEEEKVVELSHFEDFSLHADEFSANAEIFLDLENDDFHHIWEMEIKEIIEALKELPTAARIVLGLDAEHLVEMLERVVLQVARSDGDISESEGHHPDILFGWGYAKIKITTHAIHGLSENDFILAAKIDKINV